MKPIIKVNDEARIATVQNGENVFELHGTHPEGDCVGPSCILHNPSDHDLRDRPLYWHSDGFFYRVCKHAEWVYDPDQVAFWDAVGGNRPAQSDRYGCGCGFEVPRSRGVCRKCGDYIESTHRHDFVTCECGKSFVDGGSVYFRGGGYLG